MACGEVGELGRVNRILSWEALSNVQILYKSTVIRELQVKE